jgi:hypothetical protein
MDLKACTELVERFQADTEASFGLGVFALRGEKSKLNRDHVLRFDRGTVVHDEKFVRAPAADSQPNTSCP